MSGRARTFTKNTANYMSLGSGGLGALLSGLSVFSVAARVRLASTTGGLNDNNIITAIVNGTSAGMVLAIDGTGPKLRTRVRSGSGDSLQSLSATTTLSTGVDYYVGLVVNIGAKTLALFVNGASDGSASGLTFGNATWTLGTPSDNDAIGGFRAPPAATTDQLDGEISQVALWSVALGQSDFAALAAGTTADAVQVANLRWYLKIDGSASPELPTVGSLQGTITGSLPVAGQITPRAISVAANRASVVALTGTRANTVAMPANRASVLTVRASQ